MGYERTLMGEEYEFESFEDAKLMEKITDLLTESDYDEFDLEDLMDVLKIEYSLVL